MTSPLLSVSGLSKQFRRSGSVVPALAGVAFELQRGETLALIGASGSGKSTLSRILLRLIEPDSGSVMFDGVDLLKLNGNSLREIRSRLQMVFQDPHGAFNPRSTVAKAIEDPLRIHGIAAGAERPRLIASLLDRVGLPGSLATRNIHDISGGQRQRVAIARAIATNPDLIVLDEAVSALDVSVRARILQLLSDLQRERHIAYLFVSHDIAVVSRFAHRIAIMDAGSIVETGNTLDVLGAPKSTAGAALVAATPRLKYQPGETLS